MSTPVFFFFFLGSPESYATLAELSNANAEDAELLNQVRSMQIGDQIETGGGASPIFTIRRVS